jgi:hypothetical protein
MHEIPVQPNATPGERCSKQWFITILHSSMSIPEWLLIKETKMHLHKRRPSPKLSYADAVEIHKRLRRGEYLNRIAADYDVNPGRISEIKTGKLHLGSERPAI